ncbi:hypothetical protein ABN226_18670 [Morganella morganii]|uniref:hypothetical protein n=1 Tax=Morganella morganii TaxID=582 RepID=UPI0032DB28D0
MKERKEETTSEECPKEKKLPRDNINSSKEKAAQKGKFKAFIRKLFNSKECRELLENDICDNFTCLSQESSTCLTEGNPRKKGDPGALLIPCSVYRTWNLETLLLILVLLSMSCL